MTTSATAWHYECVNPAARHNKLYRAFLIDGATPAYQYGTRGTVGQLTVKPWTWETDARAQIRAQLDSKANGRGYRKVAGPLELELPDEFDPHSDGALEVLDTAFRSAWSQSWASRLDDLPDAGAGAGRQVVLLPGWAALRRTWPGQETTQPWGPPLAAALDGCPRADDPGRDITLAAVGADLARWLSSGYVPAQPTARVLTAAGAEGDTADVLTSALQLWQPAGAGPLASLDGALSTARTVIG